MRSKEDYHLEDPAWCPGCGLFGVFDAFKRAAAALDLDPEQTVVVTGIGCHGRLNNCFRAYGFHGLHGRVLPVATGVKLSHPGLLVVGISGDGDAYSIGQGHFIHALRRNAGIVYLIVDNRIYGLTQGQVSPTTDKGFVSISSPYGSKEFPIDGLRLALAAGGTFIARGFSGNVAHLAGLLEKGIRHRGFALIEALSPCVTHNKINTHEWFRKNIYALEADPGYHSGDKMMAWTRLQDTQRIPIGLIYEEQKSSFEELVLPDVRKPIAREGLEVDVPRLEKIMEKFR
jgi:2-oxoglutarate ferredoxin oxidoreductase subunit beta